MGGLGTIVGGAILGLGAASMSKTPSYGMSSQVHSSMTPSMPAAPEAPSTAADTPEDPSNNAQMEEEREKERQQAALRQPQAQEVFTSGLGAAGLADTAKKTLLGG